MLHNLNRSAPSKRTRLQSVLYNLHRSASSKSTRSERKQQLDVLPVQSSDVKDLLRWPAGAALLSSTRLDLFCGALHCLLCLALLRYVCLAFRCLALRCIFLLRALLCFALACIAFLWIPLLCLACFPITLRKVLPFGSACVALLALHCFAVL